MRRTALITGGARGIGKAISKRLAKDGLNVVICDLQNQHRLAHNTVNEINQFGGNAIFYPLDIQVKSQIENVIDKAYNKFGTFDVMVNNAGICIVNSFAGITEDELEKQWAVNVKGVLFGMQAAASKFQDIQNRSGRIINAASISAQLGMPNQGAYCSTKFAVKALTQTAAQEFASDGITVNSYCPGTVETEMQRDILEREVELGIATKEESRKIHYESSAIKETIMPDDVADLVSFLASDKSKFITGQSIIIDGGIIYR
mmetsp:Transcript_8674/g.8589  ORF Transcript_8674/g.8589 Transcript_8674/m.8589 type:complete len:260 (+) Transcript_8674:41-820(+)